MIILAIESSCDETAAAVCRDGREVLSSEVLSQIDAHVVYGGVVPEIASRMHMEAISGLCRRALLSAAISVTELDAIAVTYAPGLIGALLVGLSFAKGLAESLGIPLIPVHHIRAHVASAYIAHPELKPPFCCLMASGGNTLLLGVDGYTDMTVYGSTRDDAAGECMDKAARVMGMGYPGGAALDKLARTGKTGVYKLPRPIFPDAPYDMSFSGLKTAVINLTHNAAQKGEAIDLPALARELNETVCDLLVTRVVKLTLEKGYKTIVAAGGVAANSFLRERLTKECEKRQLEALLPPLWLCGDNAGMVGCQGYFEYLAGKIAKPEQNAFASMDV